MGIRFSSYSFVLLLCMIVIMLLGRTTLRTHLNRYIFVSAIVLSVLAFFFDPVKGWRVNGNYTDLYRFFSDMEIFEANGFSATSSRFQTNYDAIPIIKILVFLVAKTGCYSLLAMITCFIVYYMPGKVYCAITKDYNAKKSIAVNAFVCFVALTNFKVVITNVRMPIGLALFLCLIYFDLIRKKRNVFLFLGYISLLAIHSVFAIFIISRLFLFLMNRWSKWIVYILVALSGSAISIVTSFLQRYSSLAYINSILYKINYYTVGTRSEYSEPAIVFLGVIKVVVLMYIVIRSLKKNKNNNTLDFDNYCILFCVLCIGAIWNYYLFMRLTNFLWYLIPCYYSLDRAMKYTGNINYSNNGKIKIADLSLFAVVAIHFVYYFISYQYRVLCF